VSRKKAEPLGSMLPMPLQFLAAWLAVWFQRSLQQQVDYLMAENRILKEKLGDRKLDLTNADRRRLAVLGKELGRKLLAKVATLATADTILRWYREQVANKYDGSKHRGPGRPRKAEEIVELVLRMVRENESWGYTRVKGALKNLGYTIGRSTIKRILREHGIDPAPIRGKWMPWSKFIKGHHGCHRGDGLLHRRGDDPVWTCPVPRAFRDRHREPGGGDRWDRPRSRRAVDGANGTKSVGR
jgi:transposase